MLKSHNYNYKEHKEKYDEVRLFMVNGFRLVPFSVKFMASNYIVFIVGRLNFLYVYLSASI